MEQLPYFIKLLKHPVIEKLVTSQSVGDEDLKGLSFTRTDRRITIQNFALGGSDRFGTVEIFKSYFGTTVDFRTSSRKYFENCAYYFDTDSNVRSHQPFEDGKDYPFKSRRIKPYELHNRIVQGTIMLSDLLGCTIMFSFK